MTDWLAHALARYSTCEWGPLDPMTEREARRRVIDTLAVGIAALDEEGPVAARRYAAQVETVAGARIWGSALRTSVETAALVNGVAMRNLDFSDSYFGIDSTHPSDLIPGALAIAEVNGVSGRKVLEAIAIGYEVSVTIADAFGLRRHGWDHVNVTAIGACCAFGRLLRLTADQLEQALAITVVPHATMLQTCFGALTMWKGYGAPDAMRQAAYACLLAQAGVEGAPEPFVGERGFFHLMLDGRLGDRDALRPLEQLRPPKRILDTHIKAWPVGYVGQSAAEAALRLHEHVRSLDDVAAVEIDAFFVAIDLMGSADKWYPATRETADHSIPFTVATALRDGRIDPSSFHDDRVQDAVMHRFLQERVRLREDLAYTEAYPSAFPSRVTVRLHSGVAYTEEVTHPTGHAARPLSDEALQEKFMSLAEGVIGRGRAGTLLDILESLDELDTVDEVSELLVP